MKIDEINGDFYAGNALDNMASVSVCRIRKNVTYINKIGIYDGMRVR